MTDKTQQLARRMRVQALQMVHRAKASHIASALSICDIVAVLYGQVLNVNPTQPKAQGRDRFGTAGNRVGAVKTCAIRVGG